MRNLRCISLLWLIWAMAVEALPAQNPPTDNSPKVVIVEAAQWYESLPEPVFSRYFLSSNYASQQSSYRSRNKESDCYSRGLSSAYEQPEPEKQFVYQIRVRNGGEKQIAAFDWDYLFIDPETKKVIQRHSFRTQVKIRPGKAKTLSEVSASPATHVINVLALEKNPYHQVTERIVVNSIVFLDDTVWTRSGPDD